MTGRGVLAPPGETLALLPSATNRKNQGACFDPNGNLTNCVSVPASTLAQGANILLTGANPTTISAVIPPPGTAIWFDGLLTETNGGVVNAGCRAHEVM